MKINAGEIRVGMLLEYKNDLWQVLKTQHVKPGKGGAFAQVEMKSVGKNTKLNERFRSSETVEKASLEETKFNYLYDDEINYDNIEKGSKMVWHDETIGFGTVFCDKNKLRLEMFDENNKLEKSYVIDKKSKKSKKTKKKI